MDILSHTFSGLAIGATAAHFSKKSTTHKCLIIFASGVAAFFPDLDVISYWSGFDGSFGEWFGLDDLGVNIYHQKRWYSHHGLFHSLLMACVFTGLIMLGGVAYRGFFEWRHQWIQMLPLYISVFCSYLVHLLEDMPTPEFVWGGVAFLFPSENYWGGSGYIWWWNNYDLFLIIVTTFFMNLFFKLLGSLLQKSTRWIAALVLIVGFSCYLHQMVNRPFDFNYTGMKGHHSKWQINEKKSKEIQRKILGKDLFRIMEKFDNSLPIWF